jgi:hypothetical protein
MITQARLRELLAYDPATGIFTRLVANGTAKVGDVAGGVRPDGYIQISVDGEAYLAHRLAWLYVHGYWPAAHTDHIDLNREHNAIANLREATAAQNCANTGPSVNNTSGVKGVYWSKIRRKWVAQIGVGRAVRNLGGFEKIEAAKAAREAAEIEIQGVFRCQAS